MCSRDVMQVSHMPPCCLRIAAFRRRCAVANETASSEVWYGSRAYLAGLPWPWNCMALCTETACRVRASAIWYSRPLSRDSSG